MPSSAEDIERREHHRIVAVDDALESEQADSIKRKDHLDQQRAGEERVHERARKSGDDDQHRVAEHMPVQDLALAAALGARGEDVLLADLVEERVLGQQRHGGEGGEPERDDRQHHVPEVVEDLLPPRHEREVLRRQPAQRKPGEERSAGEQHDQQHRDQEPRQRVGDNDDARCPHVEDRAVLHRLADTERDRDQVAEQRQPDAERDRDRQLLLDQFENGHVAEIAPPEIEADIVPQHQEEALVRRLVEAELPLQAFDEFRIEALRAAVFRGCSAIELAGARLSARAEIAALRTAGDARAGAGVGARQHRQHALDRPARRELHDHERHQHHPENGGNDEQEAPDDVGRHSMFRIIALIVGPSAEEDTLREADAKAKCRCSGISLQLFHPVRCVFAARSRSNHHVSGMPRA